MQPIGGCVQPGKLHLALASGTPRGHQSENGTGNQVLGSENSLGFVSARINLVQYWAPHFISLHCSFPIST